MSALLDRPGVVETVKDDKGVTTNVMALIVVNRSLMRRIRRWKLAIRECIIELVEFKQSRSNKHVEDDFVWNN